MFAWLIKSANLPSYLFKLLTVMDESVVSDQVLVLLLDSEALLPDGGMKWLGLKFALLLPWFYYAPIQLVN